MVVGRADTSFKVTFSDFKDEVLYDVRKQLHDLKPAAKSGTWEFSANHPPSGRDPGPGQYELQIDEGTAETLRENCYDTYPSGPKLDACLENISDGNGTQYILTDQWSETVEIRLNYTDSAGVTHDFEDIEKQYLIEVYNESDNGYAIYEILHHFSQDYHRNLFVVKLISSLGQPNGKASIKFIDPQGSEETDGPVASVKYVDDAVTVGLESDLAAEISLGRKFIPTTTWSNVGNSGTSEHLYYDRKIIAWHPTDASGMRVGITTTEMGHGDNPVFEKGNATLWGWNPSINEWRMIGCAVHNGEVHVKEDKENTYFYVDVNWKFEPTVRIADYPVCRFKLEGYW